VRQETRDRPRIADVAREAGVSKTAVSFAFNNPERLSPDTASRIRDVATSLGYRPHPVARMLTQGRTRTLGILTPQALSVVFANPFFSTFSEGVAAVAEEAGYGLLFVSPVHGSLARRSTAPRSTGSWPSGCRRITRGGADSAGRPADRDGRLRGRLPEHPAVDVDDEGGARLAADHLLGLGHRAFLVIGVEPPTRAPTPTSRASWVGASRAIARRSPTGHRPARRSRRRWPGERRGRERLPRSRLGGRAAAHRDPRHERRDGDRRDQRRTTPWFGRPRRPQRRRIRRYRTVPPRRAAADDRAPAGPAEGRGGLPPPPLGDRARRLPRPDHRTSRRDSSSAAPAVRHPSGRRWRGDTDRPEERVAPRGPVPELAADAAAAARTGHISWPDQVRPAARMAATAGGTQTQMHKTPRLVSLFGALVLVVGACSGSATPAPSVAPSAAAPRPPRRWPPRRRPPHRPPPLRPPPPHRVPFRLGGLRRLRDLGEAGLRQDGRGVMAANPASP